MLSDYIQPFIIHYVMVFCIYQHEFLKTYMNEDAFRFNTAYNHSLSLDNFHLSTRILKNTFKRR